MITLKLFFEFLKIGLLAVGGGLATLPFLYDLSDKTGWFSAANISNMIAVSESTPGPLGINMSTYAGFLTGGISGGLIATLGLITPSLIVILIISKFLNKFDQNKTVKKTFYGLRAGALALIAVVAINMLKETILFSDLSIKPLETVLVALFILLLQKTKLHPICFIAISGILGGILSL